MKAIFLTILACALAVSAQFDPQLLNDPALKPFINKVLTDAPICLTDPAILTGKFSPNDCPGLIAIVEAISEKQETVAIECQPECNTAFAKLNSNCFAALEKAFSTGTDQIAVYGKEFFDKCDAIRGTPTAAPKPAASPSPAPATTSPKPVPVVPSPTTSPTPSDAGATGTSPSPTPSPASGAQTIKSISMALVAVLAAVILA